MANGKAKGSGWEREIAKFFTIWVTGSDKPYCYWRSPSSGALATIAHADSVSGDIIAIRPEGEFLTNIFSIEAKVGYPKADFFQHFKDVKSDIIKDFWIQCIGDAEKSDKYGMLIFKKKGLKPIVGIDDDIKIFLDEHISLPKSLSLVYDDGTPKINFYDMTQFFNVVTPQIIKMIGEKI